MSPNSHQGDPIGIWGHQTHVVMKNRDFSSVYGNITLFLYLSVSLSVLYILYVRLSRILKHYVMLCYVTYVMLCNVM